MSKTNSTKTAKTVKRGPGRPAVYTGVTRRGIVNAIKKHGLTGAMKLLKEKGVPPKVGAKAEPLPKISMPTLSKFAKEEGIKLQRGRPKAQPEPVKPKKGKKKAQKPVEEVQTETAAA